MTTLQIPSWILVFAGVSALVIGLRDPLEGPVLVVPGCIIVMLGACLTNGGGRLLSHLWRRRLLVCGIGLPLALVVYAAIFASWWFGSPTSDTIRLGRPIHEVRFTFNRVSW